MSEHVWCHGPSCHTQHTVDRVRGSKGSKVLRTRKIQFNPEYINMYSYFCSNGCYNEFANKYIQQIIAIAPRQEPLETPIENPEKTFRITYTKSNGETVTRFGKWDDKCRYWTSKIGEALITYFDLDQKGYRTAKGKWEVRY